MPDVNSSPAVTMSGVSGSTATLPAAGVAEKTHAPALAAHSRATSLLLNVGHAIDHMLLLIFATAVGAIAADFGFARWEDLMPYSVGAFFLFGLGSIASGRLGDLWGRRQMMIIFFIGIGASAVLVAAMQTAWQL